MDGSRSVERYNSVLVHNKSRVPREEMETFRGPVAPKEPKPPEPDGESFSSLHLELDNEGTCV